MSKEELQIYIRQLDHQNPEARYWAVVYLEQVADPESVTALIQALAGDDLYLMGGAAKALGAIGPAASAAIPALTECLSHEDAWVSKCAEYALDKIREK
ncbi:MAG: HEAT repeat domain-containing protein [Dehalococcoidia bacterium]